MSELFEDELFEDGLFEDGLFEDLVWRDLVTQSTDPAALRSALAGGPVVLYAGFDPTADSLHVGSLVPLLTLRRFQLAGHPPLALVGGATGLIGDPSGRTSERVLTSADVVEEWVARLREQVGRFLDLSGPAAARVVDNLDWTAPVGVLDFLREVGKHFSVNAMLGKDSVRTRLEGVGGISFTEFSYMLLQAWDFLELHRRYDCRLQIGGSDQWGNITAGLDLIRKVTGGAAHALTLPLVTSASGAKLGKTAAGTIWLDPARTSPYAFYQYWLHTDDRDVSRYLRQFTFLAREELEDLDQQARERPAARAAQRALAREVTTLVHGPGELDRVEAASAALLGGGSAADLAALDEPTLSAALGEVPHAALPAGELPTVTDLFVSAGLVEGRNAARRLVREGGAYLNNRRILDEAETPAESDLLHGRFLVLRRGRRDLAVLDRALPPPDRGAAPC
ncbi:MAG: tyrosine--tRNA ligase [Mycobacteriales bacterium]